MKLPATVALGAAAMLACAGAARGEQTALEIVKRSLDSEHRNWQRQKEYAYEQQELFREIDAKGRAKPEISKVYEVLILYGRPYRRLVKKDGRPLDADSAAKQEEKMRREMERRKKETAEENTRERRDYEKRRAEQRKFMDEIPEAYDFRITGEEPVSGKTAWVITAEPKPGYQARDSRAKMLGKIHGKLWIDQREYQWVKVEARTTDTISFGFFLARLAAGSSLRFQQQRVNDEVWLPSHLEIGMEGRLALVKKVRAQVEMKYSNYRKFQADSKVVATGSEALP